MSTTLDLMEYADDPAAQAAYVSSEAEAVDQNFETGADAAGAIGDAAGVDYVSAMKFTTSKTIFCHAASIYLQNVSGAPTGDMTFRIETDDSNEPSGTLAHANSTGTIANGSIAQPAWNKCSFTVFELAAGIYWLVVSVPLQAENNFWHWTRDDNGIGQHAYSIDQGANWTVPAENTFICYFRIYKTVLQCYSESTIKEQGDYSLKGLAEATDALNDTLTRTVDPTIDLSGLSEIKLDIRALRTGSHIKIGIHDSGGTTTEHTANIAEVDTFQTETWNISGVADGNKDVVDSIIITVVNADADNIFYIDNMYGQIVSIVANAVFFGCNF